MKRYPFKLFLSLLSTNAASEVHRKVRGDRFDGEKTRASVLVRTRYPITLFTAARCVGDGFVRNSASFNEALATSGRIITVGKLINPTRC